MIDSTELCLDRSLGAFRGVSLRSLLVNEHYCIIKWVRLDEYCQAVYYQMNLFLWVPYCMCLLLCGCLWIWNCGSLGGTCKPPTAIRLNTRNCWNWFFSWRIDTKMAIGTLRLEISIFVVNGASYMLFRVAEYIFYPGVRSNGALHKPMRGLGLEGSLKMSSNNLPEGISLEPFAEMKTAMQSFQHTIELTQQPVASVFVVVPTEAACSARGWGGESQCLPWCKCSILVCQSRCS